MNTHTRSWVSMIREVSRLIAVLLCVPLIVGSFASVAFAAAGVPRIMNYQGRLMNSSGVLLGGSGTDYCVKFALYDNASVGSGSKIWPSGSPSTMTVVVRNGVFNAGVGDTNAGGDTLDFNFEDNDAAYLNVEVATKVGATCAAGDGAESFENLSPRQRVTASGYAINSATLGGKNSAYYLANSFSTTSATAFVIASTSLPKTYANNTFIGINTFADITVTNATFTGATSTNLNVSGTISGAGLTSCSGSNDKLVWNAATRQFACGTDLSGSGGADGNWTFFNNTGLRPATTTNQVLVGGNATTSLAKFEVQGGAMFDAATSTSLNTSILGLGGSEYFTSLAGSGLQNVAGILTLNAAGDWTGTFDGQEGSYYLANSFSTTSASNFAAAGLAFSTTSAAYFNSQNPGASFSTSSADYWKIQNNFYSTTSAAYNLATYDKGYFFSTTSVAYWDSTQFRWATTSSDAWLATKSTTNLAEGSNLYYTPTRVAGVIAGTTTDALAEGATNKYFTTNNFATELAATTTDALAEGSTNQYYTPARDIRFSTTSASHFSSLGLAFSTTSASYFLAQNPGASFSTSSADYWRTQNNFYSTTSAAYDLATYDKGYFFSTTSVAFWDSTQFRWATTSSDAWLATKSTTDLPEGSNLYYTPARVAGVIAGTTTDALAEGSTNQYYTPVRDIRFSTTSALFFSANGLSFSTTSTDYYKSQNNFFSTTSASHFSALGLAFSTTSASYFLGQNGGGASFSTTSADYYTSSSTTIPKTYTNNTFTGTNIFGNVTATGATTTSTFSGTASSTNLFSNLATIGSLITGAFTGNVITATNATTTTLYTQYASTTNINANTASVGSASVGSLSLNSALSGTNGGTGLNSVTQNALLIGGAGNTWTQISTSSLGLATYGDLGAYLGLAAWYATTTDGLAEGTNNRYFTTNRLATALAATTTDAIAEGVANFYYTPERDIRFSTTSASYFAAAGLAFSSTSAAYFNAQNPGASFSTSSADYYKSQNNFHSTTSFAYNLSTYSLGSFFSTTSVAYWDSTQFRWATTSSDAWLATKSTTDLAEGTNLYYTPTRVAGVIAGTTTDALAEGGTNQYYTPTRVAGVIAGTTTDALAEGSTNQYYTPARDIRFSTTSANYFSSLGLSFSTTSTDYYKSQNNFFSTTSASNFSALGLAFSTTSAAYFNSQNAGASFSTTSTDYWKTQNNFFSTTSAGAFLALNQGNAFSTTSAAYNLSNYDKGFFFSTTSTDYWKTQTSFFSTSSTDFWKTQNNFFSTTSASHFTSLGLAFSTTSTAYYLGQNQGAAFSTTSANHFVHSSTTIPKTYTANTFTALNTFDDIIAADATTTALFAQISTSVSAFFGQFSATSTTATSTINGALAIGIASPSYRVSILGQATGATSATGTAVVAISNDNNTLSSGNNVLRLNLRTAYGTACVTGTTCPRFTEYFTGVGAGSDTGGRGVGSLRLSTAGTGITQTSGSADFAEYMQLSESAAVGDIVSLNASGEYRKASAGESLIGVISDNPAFVGNGNLEGEPNAYIVGFAGVIPTKVSTANGSINAGDLIAASDVPGVGMKLTESGYALGQALQSYSGPGEGTITILVMPKFVDAAIALESYGGGASGDSGYWNLSTSTNTIALASSSYSVSIGSSASTSNLVVSNGFTFGKATGVLKSVAGVVSSSLLNLASDVTGVLGISNGGTGTSTPPGYGQILVGNAAGGYDLVATSSLGNSTGSAVWGAITGTLSAQTDLQNALNLKFSLSQWYATTTDALAEGSANLYYTPARDIRFSTTSADYYKAQNNFFSTTSASNFASAGLAFSTTSAAYYASQNVTPSFSTTSASYFSSAGLAFSTTSAAYNLSTYSLGSFFSTTSVAFWDSTQFRWATTSSDAWLATKSTTNLAEGSNLYYTPSRVAGVIAGTTTDALAEGSTNQYYTPARDIRFSTTSALFFSANGLSFSTTSTDYYKSQNNFFSTTSASHFSALGLAFSTTSASYFLGQNGGGASFSTTSADYYTSSSTTIPKTYTNNSFTGTNIFGNVTATGATTTTSFTGTASSTNLFSNLATIGSLITGAITGNVITATNATTTTLYTQYASTTNINANTASVGSASVGSLSLGSALSGGNGGTGLSTVAQNALLIGGAGNTWTQVSTSSLGLPTFATLNSYLGLSAWYATTTDGLTEGSTNKYYNDTLVQTYLNGVSKGFFFSTTSASSFAAAGLAFSTTSANAYLALNQGNSFSTTSSAYNLSTYDKGYFFSTTSIAFWDSNQFRWATTSSDAWLATKSTTDLPEGSNLYYTPSRVAGVIAGTTTDALAEGSTNQYYTPVRDIRFSTTSALFFSSNGLSFSTTSTDYYKAQNNFFSTTSASAFTSLGLAFSTTSASAFLSQNQGAAFSTTSASNFASAGLAFSSTSAAYYNSQNAAASFSTTSANYASNAWANASTTLPKTYTANTFTGTNSFQNITATGATTTALTTNSASTSNLVISTLQNSMLYTGPGGVVTGATISGPLSFSAGTLSISQADASGTNGYLSSADYTSFNSRLSTSTLGLVDKGFFFSTTSTDYWKTQSSFFSTSSTDFWKTQNNFFSTTSASAFTSLGLAFSTTSTAYFLGQNQGAAFSTTSASNFAAAGLAHSTTSVAYQLSQNTTLGNSTSTTSFATTASSTNAFANTERVGSSTIGVLTTVGTTTGSNGVSIAAGCFAVNGVCQGNDGTFSTSSASFFVAQGLAFSTTSANAWAGFGLGFSTTSSSYFLLQNQSQAFSTTSASYFSSIGLAFSTTSANAWAGYGLGFSTTSASYHLSQNQGAAFSTTSANYASNLWANGSTTLPKTFTANTFTGTNSFQNVTATGATTTALSTTNASTTNLWISSVRNGLVSTNAQGTVSTTTITGPLSYSANTLSISQANGTTNGYVSSIDWNAFNSRLSTSTLALFDKGYFFSTTSADVYVTATTSLAKTYANNTFIGVNAFANITATGATTTTLFSGTASSTNIFATAARFGTLSGFSLSGALAAAGNSITGINIASSTDLWVSNIRNGLLATNAQGNVVATSSPTAASFNATSATVASQFTYASSTALSALQQISIGAANGTILQGAVAGTSTIAGVISVTGTNSTSTFSGGLQATRLNLTAGTSTAAGGFNLTSGCFAVNGVCVSGAVNSVSATNTSLTVNPTGGNVGISLNLSNPNLWTGLQQFGNATTSLLEATQFYARTIQSTSSNALILKSNLSSTAGLTFGSTSTPQVLAVDTINNRVTLGTGGGAPSLLVLDNKNTPGDPTGTPGAQYYNSSSDEFRCYFGTSWVTCGGAAASSTGDVQFRNVDGSFTATSNFDWSLANNRLSLTANANQATDIFTISSSTGETLFSVGNTGVLNLATTSDQAIPTSGLDIYAKSIANRVVPKWVGPAGIDTPFQAAIWQNNIVTYIPGVAAGVWSGTNPGANLGTVAIGTQATTNFYTTQRRTRFSSIVTTLNQQVGIRSDAMFFRGSAAGQGGFFFAARVGFDTWTANDRLFVGFSTGTTAVCTVNPTTLVNVLGFSINSASTSISFISNDNAGNATVQSTIPGQPALATNNGYAMYIFAKPADTVVYWQLDDVNTGLKVAEGSVNTDLPVNTTFLTAHICMSNGSNTAVNAAQLGVNKLYIETDR